MQKHTEKSKKKKKKDAYLTGSSVLSEMKWDWEVKGQVGIYGN